MDPKWQDPSYSHEDPRIGPPIHRSSHVSQGFHFGLVSVTRASWGKDMSGCMVDATVIHHGSYQLLLRGIVSMDCLGLQVGNRSLMLHQALAGRRHR